MNKPDIRLASRSEGEYVNFYLASGDTMDGAMLIMSVHASGINIKGWEFIKDIAVEIVKEGLQRAGIQTDRWETQPAPEHERSGRA
jgi:hypothetical protein